MVPNKTQAELDNVVLDGFARENAAKIMDELRQFLCVANLLDVNSMLEIGCENGGSFSCWQKLYDPCKFFIVDADLYGIPVSRQDRVNRWTSWLSPRQTLDVTWGDSHSADTITRLKSAMSARGVEKVDLLMIDGDHSEAGTMMDYEMYSPLVRSGGLIVVEDINPHCDADGRIRMDVMGYKAWARIRPEPIDQNVSREPHPRKNWHAFEIMHDKGRQTSFGFGLVFVP